MYIYAITVTFTIFIEKYFKGQKDFSSYGVKIIALTQHLSCKNKEHLEDDKQIQIWGW